MKKKMNLVLVLLLMFVLAGCGKTAVSDNTDKPSTNEQVGTEKEKEKKEENVSKGEVSLEAVKKASETDESDFEYEEIEGGVSISKYVGNDKIVVIPEEINGKSVLEVGEQAFSNNEMLEGIKIADSVTVLNRMSFSNCTNLNVVVMGNNVKEVKMQAFLMCTSLKDVELNNRLEILGDSCFSYTEALKEIYIPDSVVKVDRPFLEDGLSNVTIITEAGSAAEQYANEYGFECKTK